MTNDNTKLGGMMKIVTPYPYLTVRETPSDRQSLPKATFQALSQLGTSLLRHDKSAEERCQSAEGTQHQKSGISNMAWETPNSNSSQTTTYQRLCLHRGDKINVGEYFVYAGGDFDLKQEDYAPFDILVALTGSPPRAGDLWKSFKGLCIHFPMIDYGGVPPNFDWTIAYLVNCIKEGSKVLVYCMGGHGRTGTVLAAILGALEPNVEDPIKELRSRYCENAVESSSQARGVYKCVGIDPNKEGLSKGASEGRTVQEISSNYLVDSLVNSCVDCWMFTPSVDCATKGICSMDKLDADGETICNHFQKDKRNDNTNSKK